MNSCNDNLDCGTAVPAAPAPAPTPCPDRTCSPQTSVCGDWTTTVSSTGCTTRTRTGFNITDGVYQNPTITVLNGCISAIAPGTRVIQSRPEPCASAGGTPAPTPAPTLTLSPAPCNLLSVNINGLYAGLVFNQLGQSISATGCGTAVSPLVLSYTGAVATVNSLASSTFAITNVGNAYTVNSVGVTFALNCGYRIENGIVKSFIIPIHTITAGRGVTAAQTTLGNNCDWTVASTATSKTIIGVLDGALFVDPQSGTPAGTGSWDKGTAIVYGNRLFLDTDYPAVVYDSAGATITTSPSFITYGSPALALAALDTVYSFAGIGG